MPATAVQEALRQLFARWGLPQRIRVDNGAPWASWTDPPPALALWWVGLGIEPIWNHPHSPRENAKVERCNGLIEPWGEPEQCADLAAFAERLAWVVRVQREQYPAVHGQSRLAAHPGLATNPRCYTAAGEREQFDLGRVQQYLAAGRWPRVVSKIGQITLYGQAYAAGRAWRGQQVWVQLDAARGEWVIRSEQDQELRRHAATQISTEHLCTLTVAHPRPPSRRKSSQT